MLIDLGVVCAWIAMSLTGAICLGLLRRFGADSTLAVEFCHELDEPLPDELHSLEQPLGASLAG